ncbi:ABC transporter permease [Streptomyces sp. PKU-EA00015]|uniref:ABC transporter permease n=1 Tax=Streptomyces sp. PKU-EA00015 TaxID=2748326 RepID=UPI0015A23D74|nr:ABC transporter permease [Streptomyces sp. PKU-EA00015]NWF27717.1 ABC transporter permease [Streptomyces sp. PKU-EA00015]
MSALSSGTGGILRGTAWVVVRQHRTVLGVAAGALVLSAAVAAGLRIWFEATPPDDFDRNLFPRSDVRSTLLVIVEYAGLAAMLLPLLVAAAVAGPVVARELESGTYKLAWSQSVTPLRWFATKVTVPAVTVTALMAALIGVFRLAWEPVSTNTHLRWYSRHVFLAIGPTAIAYGLLAVAVGALTGLLVRRTLAAMSVAGLATGAVLMLMSSQWHKLWTTRSGSRSDPERFPLTEDWFFTDTGLLTVSGERLGGDTCLVLDREACLAERDIVGRWYDYHPASHLWPLQLVETGIVLALAAAVAWAAFRIFRRRHG